MGDGANGSTDGYQAPDRDRPRKDIETRAPEQEKSQAGVDEVPGGEARLSGGPSVDTKGWPLTDSVAPLPARARKPVSRVTQGSLFILPVPGRSISWQDGSGPAGRRAARSLSLSAPPQRRHHRRRQSEGETATDLTCC